MSHLPAQPDILDDVFRFGCATEHTVGDAEETRTHFDELRERVVRFEVHALILLAGGERSRLRCESPLLRTVFMRIVLAIQLFPDTAHGNAGKLVDGRLRSVTALYN